MAGFPFSEWILSGMVASKTPRSTENRRTKGFCCTTTVMWTPDTNNHCWTLCLTVRFNSRLRGSFFTRNGNASKRSSPDSAILTALCSQPFADSLTQKCLRIHIPDWLIKDGEAPVRIVLPYKDQKSANVLRKQLVDLSRRINADISPV